MDVFESEFETLLVVVGRTVATRGEAVKFLEVSRSQFEAGQLTGGERTVAYSRSRIVRYIETIPGMVYSFHSSNNNGMLAVKTATAHYEGLWPDRVMRLKWQELDRIDIAKIALRNEERNDKRDVVLYDLLKPLRDTYAEMAAFDRELYIARIVRYITSGSRREESRTEDD